MSYLDHDGFIQGQYSLDTVTEVYVSDTDFAGLPSKGATYMVDGLRYSLDSRTITRQGSNKTKRELTLVFRSSNPATDGAGGFQGGSPWEAVASLDIDYTTTEYASRKDAEGNNIVNSAGAFPSVPPAREIVVPVYTLIRARELSSAGAAVVGNSINGKVNAADFNAFGLSFVKEQALFSYQASIKYWGPEKTVYAEERITISVNPLTWVTPIIDEGHTFLKNGKLEQLKLRLDSGAWHGYVNANGSLQEPNKSEIRYRTTSILLNGKGKPLPKEDGTYTNMPTEGASFNPGDTHPRTLPAPMSSDEAVYLGYWMHRKADANTIKNLDLDYNFPGV